MAIVNENFDKAYRAACAAVGVIDKAVPYNGQWYSADLIDDPRGRGDGRIKFFADGQGGIVWNHKSGERQTFFINNQVNQSLTPDEKKKREAQRKQSEQTILKRRAKASHQAKTIWKAAKPVENHPYLSRKGIFPYQTRCTTWHKKYKDKAGKWQQLSIENTLLVPMYDKQGTLKNLQGIFPSKCNLLDRDKDTLPGGQTQGCFWWLGSRSDVVCVAEGFATAATIQQETGFRVYISFTAGNLLPVGQIIREKCPNARIIFTADNDTKTKGNPGLSKANEAAAAVGGFVAVPPVAGDFNDYAAMLKGG